MKKCDIEDKSVYLNATKIAKEINRSISENEPMSDELKDQLQNNDTINVLIHRLKSESRQQQLYEEFGKCSPNENLTKLIKCVQKQNRKRLYFRLFGSSIAAAILVSFLLILDQEKPSALLHISNNENNDYRLPTLVLENGENISLTKEDITVDNGKYRIEKSAGDPLRYIASHNDNLTTYNTLIVPSGYTSSVVLSDGTEVILNAGSNLRFPVVFSLENRMVELNGEAYFKVKKSEKPFIVKTEEGEVKVYGTEFNVKSVGSGIFETVLVSGLIGVRIDTAEEIKVHPNQMFYFNKTDQRMELSHVDVTAYIQWIENNFNYDDYSLVSILDDLASWYGLEFIYNKEIQSIKMSFFACRETDINEILEIIEIGTDVKFKKEKGGIYRVN